MARQYEAQNLLLVRLDAKRAMQMHLSIKPAMLDRFDDVCMQELMAVVQRWLPDRLSSRAPEGEVHLHEGASRNLLLCWFLHSLLGTLFQCSLTLRSQSSRSAILQPSGEKYAVVNSHRLALLVVVDDVAGGRLRQLTENPNQTETAPEVD